MYIEKFKKTVVSPRARCAVTAVNTQSLRLYRDKFIGQRVEGTRTGFLGFIFNTRIVVAFWDNARTYTMCNRFMRVPDLRIVHPSMLAYIYIDKKKYYNIYNGRA